MRESTIERYLCEQVKKYGGLCEKFKTGKVGPPDRLVSWPNRKSELQACWAKRASTHFVELKTLLGKLSKAQSQDHKKRKLMGLDVWVLRSKADVDYFIKLTK